MARLGKWILLGICVAGTCLPYAGCRRSRGGAVRVGGSTSIQPFAEMLAEDFNKTHAAMAVEVQGGGSAQGLATAASGIADIGMCSRALKKTPEEAGRFTAIQIASDGLAIIVHLSNPMGNLSRRQVQDIFAGAVTNWRDVGGADMPIRLITREEGSGTREAFTNMVMGKSPISPKALTQESNGAVKELVKNDPAAIGYMSLGLVKGEAKILDIDGVSPSIEAVTGGRYPLVRPFLFVILPGRPVSAGAQAYIDYVLSPAGQQTLEREGLIRSPLALAAGKAAAWPSAASRTAKGEGPP